MSALSRPTLPQVHHRPLAECLAQLAAAVERAEQYPGPDSENKLFDECMTTAWALLCLRGEDKE